MQRSFYSHKKTFEKDNRKERTDSFAAVRSVQDLLETLNEFFSAHKSRGKTTGLLIEKGE